MANSAPDWKKRTAPDYVPPAKQSGGGKPTKDGISHDDAVLDRNGGQPLKQPHVNSYADHDRNGSDLNGSDRSSIAAADLPRFVADWLLEGECRMLSPRTTQSRRNFLKNLGWFLGHRGYRNCGVPELRQFFHYLLHGHEEPGGRWGNAQLTRPVRPITVKDYHVCFKSFFGWLQEEGLAAANPIERIAAPKVRTDHKQPLTPDQMQALFQAARHSKYARRDEAILLFLVDTGVRSSELVTLRMSDLDLQGRRCTVLGKGNKYRTVFFGRVTARALASYFRAVPRDADGPVFLAETRHLQRVALTRSGLQQLVTRLGRAADIPVKVSPHWFRRTFAVEILKNGANVFSLREMLGHTNLQMTQKYLALAQADIEAQHRQYSPADRLEQTQKKR